MAIELLSCGYSFHKEKFHIQKKSGLKTYLFRLQTEGRAQAKVDNTLVTIEVGDLLLFQPGDPYELVINDVNPHAKYAISSGDYFLFCQGSWVDEWWHQTAKPTLSRITLDENVLTLWRQLSLEKRRIGAENTELIGYLLRSLCLYLDRARLEASPMQDINYNGLQMKRYIEKHATLPMKIEDVAKQVGLSVSRAVHVYKACFGKSMIQYAMEIKLSVAKERMHYTALNLEQIAEDCGFHSYPHFHRSFKKQYGLSPKTYRTQASKLWLAPYS